MSEPARGPGLGKMITAGFRALRRYPGLAVSIYLVQFFTSAVAAWVMARALAAGFSRQPLFDRAVDGDWLARIVLLRDNLPLAAALVAIGVGTAIAYAALSWFLTGGLIATLLERPTGRRQVAERFGGGGAATFSAYARLWLWCLVPYGAAVITALVGAAFAVDDLEHALTLSDAVRALLPTALPAALLLWITTTAVAYARVDLSRHRDLAPFRALLGGYLLLATRARRALVHSLLYCTVWIAITLVLLAITHDRPMLGAAGALWLLFLRQTTAALRFAAKVALVGGQVELARAISSRRGGARAR